MVHNFAYCHQIQINAKVRIGLLRNREREDIYEGMQIKVTQTQVILNLVVKLCLSDFQIIEGPSKAVSFMVLI